MSLLADKKNLGTNSQTASNCLHPYWTGSEHTPRVGMENSGGCARNDVPAIVSQSPQKNVTVLGDGWLKVTDAQGQTYYEHRLSNKIQFDAPKPRREPPTAVHANSYECMVRPL